MVAEGTRALRRQVAAPEPVMNDPAHGLRSSSRGRRLASSRADRPRGGRPGVQAPARSCLLSHSGAASGRSRARPQATRETP
jgi:hypothetical protein